MVDSEVAGRLQQVRNNIKAATLRRPQGSGGPEVRLLAVCKTQPVERILAAYKAGQRHFGGNYVQELEERGFDPEIRKHCPDIRWHLIGHLQSNKVNRLTRIPGLHMVETVDSRRIATALNASYQKVRGSNDDRLQVMVQVNTSAEEQKSGCDPAEASGLVRHIHEQCPCLEAVGLMTIGQYDYDVSRGPNPDMLRLLECRREVASALGVAERGLELSMGMTADYEHAIELGSTHVRVGEAIFGKRDAAKMAFYESQQ